MYSSRRFLYRSVRLAVILAVFGCWLALPLYGQYTRSSKQSQGPRATALLEITGKTARLVPIAILINGKFYDASVYRATPRPMALEPGNVYEAEQGGQSVGLFTIGDAQEVSGTWYGVGKWKPAGPPNETAVAKVQVGGKTSAPPADEDQPPILRRGSKPASAPSTQPPPQQAPVSQSPGSPAGPAAAPPKSSTEQEDTDRPVLRRGKPQPAPKSVNPRPTAASADSKKPEAAKQAPAEASAEARYQLLAAVSDADGPEPRPFTYEANPTQRSNYEKELGALARNAVGKYEGERQAGSPRVELGISKFRVFDVDFSNQAVFVFVAPATVTFGPRAQRTSRVQQPAPSIPEGVQAYVTVVARLDIYGEVRQLFSSVTDARHLDQIPRLEFIDAVDADGDGRGELLFREVTDSGQGFAIYRVLPDTLSKIFDSMGPAD